ncbi:DNA-binding response OmpR family regulator [Clostridium tetanomorphum]|uniref:Stage 0 sporulation protein A homolog n=1 Tax=Clostridium tetanomorphum TaxID=1553 RepID=A0A923IYW8_CLOTT|nr:response regulator transcription factor [Clostridium tetanomorphum]KAJ50975.1 two-component response regulator [Clostridium tetanomorphum DSM 665]MBC2396342.1 response regulator transcription factor [Clostridium tetanomorphum]MBP1863429.1 DNA-binding response OmpR family regulator [Clostridium tetanomorphum]NRS83526.1 DNA-binding response OmpR family regulator [Clostridium tetanomorphum]NRZ96726.1 DNA-binding response OmpR family regulator [Clostridium tetanomorphum]
MEELNNINILIVEDDKEINNLIKTALTKDGFNIVQAFDGMDGFAKYKSIDFSIIILDIMLPYVDGMEIMKKIREESVIPIIILSAKVEESDRIIGLGLGADDYIVKPFFVGELVARVKSQLRRYISFHKNEKIVSIIKKGNITLDLDNYCAYKKEEKIILTAKEFELLKLFFTNPNRVFTKMQIFENVWNEEYMGDDNTVMVHIRRLRNKIENNPNKPEYILTVWGIGYKLGDIE